MEEKKITKQESLEIISQMIEKTKKESAIGSGNMFLMWGYLCVFISLVVFAMSFTYHQSGWGWLYMAVPIVGFITAGFLARWMKKKYHHPSTYASESISMIWGCLSLVFAAYAIICILHYDKPDGWKGMFLLGLLLPGIGTTCTGTILKEDWVRWCGQMGVMFGLFFLLDLNTSDYSIELKWPIMMAISMVFTLVIPGHILNHKAKKTRLQADEANQTMEANH